MSTCCACRHFSRCWGKKRWTKWNLVLALLEFMVCAALARIIHLQDIIRVTLLTHFLNHIFIQLKHLQWPTENKARQNENSSIPLKSASWLLPTPLNSYFIILSTIWLKPAGSNPHFWTPYFSLFALLLLCLFLEDLHPPWWDFSNHLTEKCSLSPLNLNTCSI